MNNLRIRLYHQKLDLLSDRTFRALLKRLSALSREIQTQEVLHFVNNSRLLELREKQSINDRIKPSLNHIPSYYIEKIEKGSLEIVLALTAFALWLLQQTVGETIKEAWKKTQFHKELVDYLSSDFRKKI